MAREAATGIVRAMIKSGALVATEESGSIDDIVRVTQCDRHLDGYQIARELEKQRHWDCDFSIAECLDSFSAECHLALEVAEKVWAAENPMPPPFAAGTVVKTPHGAGPIERIYEYGPAKYIVLVDGRHLIIPFEDVYL